MSDPQNSPSKPSDLAKMAVANEIAQSKIGPTRSVKLAMSLGAAGKPLAGLGAGALLGGAIGSKYFLSPEDRQEEQNPFWNPGVRRGIGYGAAAGGGLGLAASGLGRAGSIDWGADLGGETLMDGVLSRLFVSGLGGGGLGYFGVDKVLDPLPRGAKVKAEMLGSGSKLPEYSALKHIALGGASRFESAKLIRESLLRDAIKNKLSIDPNPIAGAPKATSKATWSLAQYLDDAAAGKAAPGNYDAWVQGLGKGKGGLLGAAKQHLPKSQIKDIRRLAIRRVRKSISAGRWAPSKRKIMSGVIGMIMADQVLTKVR